MYAVFESGGKQHSVSVGDVVYVEKLKVDDGSSFSFDKVLMLSDGKVSHFGKPYVAGATIVANALKTAKSKKIRVFKYKPKKNYKRTIGHRQFYTKLEIKAINFKN